MWLSLGKCTQCFSVKWAKTSSPRVNKPLTAVHVAFIPALFLTEECCTHFQWFLSLLFKCSDWWSILELQLRSQGSLLPVPTERERERERETLVGSGHEIAEQNEFWGRSPLSLNFFFWFVLMVHAMIERARQICQASNYNWNSGNFCLNRAFTR